MHPFDRPILARVFEEAGWLGRDAILMTGINSIIYVLSTLPPWYLVDRWGRRPILLSGAVIVCRFYFQFILNANFRTDGRFISSHWLVDVCRCSCDAQSRRRLRNCLQRGLWIQLGTLAVVVPSRGKFDKSLQLYKLTILPYRLCL